MKLMDFLLTIQIFKFIKVSNKVFTKLCQLGHLSFVILLQQISQFERMSNFFLNERFVTQSFPSV